MAKKIKVLDIMTPNVIVANTTTPFDQIIDFFDLYNIQHLPVAENDRLIGILSINDIMKYMVKKLKSGAAMNMASLLVTFDIKEVMTVNPVCVTPDSDFSEVIEILATGKFQSVPVVKEGLIVGIITNKDIVKFSVPNN